jgi:hypothetical protein
LEPTTEEARKMKNRLFASLMIVALLGASGGALAQDCVKAVPLPKLRIGEGLLDFNDHKGARKPICVVIGGSFDIKIKTVGGYSVGIGAIQVRAKSASGPTIEGTNDPVVNKVTVTVDGTASTGDEFGFIIEVDGVGILDPMVRIVETDAIERGDLTDINEFLEEELGMSLEELQKLSTE